jgi:hypothetical protein
MSNRTIISLGILKVNWDNFKIDYIENFIPLIAECIRLCEDDVVSLPSLQTHIINQFGLDLPQHVIETILKRVKKRKFIYIENGVYHVNRKQLANLHFKEVRDEVLCMHEEVITNLINFAHEKYSISWSQNDAENVLLSFLEENELRIISTTIRGSTIPEIKYTEHNPKYVISSYVRELQITHSNLLNYFDTIVKGNMLANAIFLPDVYEPQKNFKNTEVYFDTSFLINALGFAGDTRQAPCLELLKLLYKSGANLRCFEHTKTEITGALDAVSAQLSRGREYFTYGPGIPTFEYFLSKGFSHSNLEILIGRIKRDLNELKILVVDKPDYLPEITIDEKGLLQFITDHVKYWREKAAEKDVDSISAIYRLRKCREFLFIEECKAIFVTSNKKLVKAVSDYFYQSSNPSSIPPCITDFSITNLLWLKLPNAAPDLPIKRIIADCFAATQPNEELWTKYLREIDQLEKDKKITADDYYYLRYSIEAKTALMDSTLGEPETFTQGTVNEILDLVKDRLRADLVEKLEKSEERVWFLELEKEEKIKHIKMQSNKRARLIINIIRYTSLLLLITITILTAPWFKIAISLPLVFWILWTLLAITSILTSHYGTSTEALLRKLELSFSLRIERKLYLAAYINPDDNLAHRSS